MLLATTLSKFILHFNSAKVNKLLLFEVFLECDHYSQVVCDGNSINLLNLLNEFSKVQVVLLCT